MSRPEEIITSFRAQPVLVICLSLALLAKDSYAGRFGVQGMPTFLVNFTPLGSQSSAANETKSAVPHRARKKPDAGARETRKTIADF